MEFGHVHTCTRFCYFIALHNDLKRKLCPTANFNPWWLYSDNRCSVKHDTHHREHAAPKSNYMYIGANAFNHNSFFRCVWWALPTQAGIFFTLVRTRLFALGVDYFSKGVQYLWDSFGKIFLTIEHGGRMHRPNTPRRQLKAIASMPRACCLGVPLAFMRYGKHR